MTISLLLIAFIIILCVVLNRVSDKVGIPILFFFILLGMMFGSEGLFRIQFDNYEFAEQICSIALIFIMFYGGFGTNWKQAKSVALWAGILATLGVVFTAALVGVFCHYALGMGLMESLLLGAVISSTDAASVFAILRSKKLALKEHTDSLLEIESGSNDPCSYMMTLLVLTMMQSSITTGEVAYMVFAQFLFGILVSIAVAAFAVHMLRKFHFSTDGLDMIFVIGIAILAYAGANAIGGNGYLSTYLVGIVLGNSKIRNKQALVPFFDGLTGLMQVLVFFLLGLLAFPHILKEVAVVSIVTCIFLTFVGRPIAVFLLLAPFQCSVQQKLLVSFAGLRGAASIVFATMATVSSAYGSDRVFHIVFGMVLISIAFQGTLIPWVAKRLDMIDHGADVLKTFTDYVEEANVQFVEFTLQPGHPWIEKTIATLSLVSDMIIVLIRRNRQNLMPTGDFVLQEGDRIVLGAPTFNVKEKIPLEELTIDEDSEWVGKTIAEVSDDPKELIVLIERNGSTIIPRGDTVLHIDDTLVYMREE